ncbi:DUF1097 domain-containing protein [Ferrimonas lipolytica]|uniref:DUF1097 domain-containing protein n=1 Tax=Ferrimonas lipolytica TaxID=2724191 RepID=A0A6H1UC62_9GAMM|nr:DUF1097 domain-containing protein [Ferrimonas lipolytica]QIZ76170.1 DUF1097 domain-containing protein [Ferrimonas lipolytica]
MSALVAISITTGILSALWGWLSVALGLLTWAGFMGCSTYFAAPAEGKKAVAISMLTNLSGVFWGMVIIQLSTVSNIEVIGYIITGIVSMLMCIQAKKEWLNYIPGTFLGCCATFASNGNWQMVVPSLLVGVLFGAMMKSSGLWLQAKLQPQIKNQVV